MEKNQNKTNQHFVPRFILRYFKDSKANNDRIYVLDKKTFKVFSSSIAKVGCEKDFYTLKGFEDKYRWDKFYTDREPKMAENYRDMIDSILRRKAVGDIDKLKDNFSEFLAIQLLRGLKCIKFPNEKIDQLNSLWDSLGCLTFERDEIPKDYYEFMATNSELRDFIKNFLSERIWIFFSSEKDVFVTSDNPIIFFDFTQLENGQFLTYLDSRTSIVCYPLNPKTMLVMFHKKYRRLQGKDMGIQYMTDLYEEHWGLLRNNMNQFNQCDRFVYACNKELLDNIAEKIRKTDNIDQSLEQKQTKNE